MFKQCNRGPQLQLYPGLSHPIDGPALVIHADQIRQRAIRLLGANGQHILQDLSLLIRVISEINNNHHLFIQVEDRAGLYYRT